ncbi:hypothetical protein G6F56_009791 [Rhizopus delemar]|nr:hypothetical protein G6F56_009791 [Rhizopus delemar]
MTNKANIPRPLNCFLIYRNEMQKEILEQCPGANHRDLSKIIAKRWREATELEKEPFRIKSRIAKQEHTRMYPDYKYAPKRKETPKRAYIRKRQHEKFTSRSIERNLLMESIFGHEVDNNSSSHHQLSLKKSSKKKSAKAAVISSIGKELTSCDFELLSALLDTPLPFEGYNHFDCFTPLLECDTSSSGNSPVLSFHSETPQNDSMTTYFNQDLEDCLSFSSLDMTFDPMDILLQQSMTTDMESMTQLLCKPDLSFSVDYADPMFLFNQLL